MRHVSPAHGHQTWSECFIDSRQRSLGVDPLNRIVRARSKSPHRSASRSPAYRRNSEVSRRATNYEEENGSRRLQQRSSRG